MKHLFCPIILLVSVCSPAALGQKVVITPKKVIYTRPKPLYESKKTFTVRRPIAKAATPSLSRRIAAAISPESVLQLNVREELGEYQWLEEADYEVLYNRDDILSLKLWMTGAGAYPDDVSRYAVVDARTGARLRPADIFTNLTGLAATLRKAQQNEIRSSIEELKKDPDGGDIDSSQLFSEANFTAADLKEFSVNSSGVTFYYDYGFPHVIKALQPSGEYSLTWSQLRPYIRRGGLLARFVS